MTTGTPLGDVAPLFIEIAHRIVWCTVATVDRAGRPRTRILHPIWSYQDDRLTGWFATSPIRSRLSTSTANPRCP